MKHLRLIFIAILLISSGILYAQEDQKQNLFKFSGYVQAGYRVGNIDEIKSNSFYLHRAILTLDGGFSTKNESKVDYCLMMNATTPNILELWVRYMPAREFGIQVGQFRIPLTIENSDYAPLRIELIDYSQPIIRLNQVGGDVSGINSAGREMGLKLFGGFIHKEHHSIINYDFAVLNGNGINRRDNDQSKDIIGRLRISPIRYLSIAGYYQDGTFKVGEAASQKLNRYGGGVCYDDNTFVVRSEYVGGKTGDILSEGAYLLAGYHFTEKFMAVARADYFKFEKELEDYDMFYTLGLTYQPVKKFKIQANYTLKNSIFSNNDKIYTHLFNIMATAIF